MEMTRYASSYSFVIATSETMVTRPWPDQLDKYRSYRRCDHTARTLRSMIKSVSSTRCKNTGSVTMIHLSKSALG